jgi:hypothetical protein
MLLYEAARKYLPYNSDIHCEIWMKSAELLDIKMWCISREAIKNRHKKLLFLIRAESGAVKPHRNTAPHRRFFCLSHTAPQYRVWNFSYTAYRTAILRIYRTWKICILWNMFGTKYDRIITCLVLINIEK